MKNLDYIRSPIRYTGNKYRLLDDILRRLPKNIDNFVDLFSGSMTVGINVNANKIYINDRIQYLIDLYKYFNCNDIEFIISQIHNRISEYDLSKGNKEQYLAFREHYNSTNQCLDLFILSCYSYNHLLRFNVRDHKFNTPFGLREYNKDIENDLVRFCQALHSKNFIFSSLDFRNFDFSVLHSGDVVYCDPPYSISVGVYNDGNRGFGGWSAQDDLDLLNILDDLNNRGIIFIMSNVIRHKGECNDQLLEWSKKYNVEYVDMSYRGASYNLRDRYNKTEEVLISNAELAKRDTCKFSRIKLF